MVMKILDMVNRITVVILRETILAQFTNDVENSYVKFPVPSPLLRTGLREFEGVRVGFS